MNARNTQLFIPTLSVVVPVYRSQETLRELHHRLITVLEPIDPNFELILVEDCGGDDSWHVIETLATRRSSRSWAATGA